MYQSIESSNRIEGVTVSSTRFEAIMRQGTEPQNPNEAEITGYRDVLLAIHQHHKDMEPTPNLILQLHRDMMKYTASGGRWKAADNYIEETLPTGERRIRFATVPAWQTPQAMADLCTAYHGAIRQGGAPDLVHIAAFVLDFLCVHPFADGNGRMSRLLTLLLLYRQGYTVGRYISLERIVEDTKDRYYDCLDASSSGWHEGHHNLLPWLEYFVPTVHEAYQRLEKAIMQHWDG